MPACTPLVVIEVSAEPITITAGDGTDPTITGNNAGLALSAGEVTCCAEEIELTVGVKYNAQWKHDGAVNFQAQVN